jgi:SAM-dependent methyltransferase
MPNYDQAAVWQKHALQWSHIGSPLKPSLYDGELLLDSLAQRMLSLSSPFHVAILGVTPEIINLPWPDNVELLAFDHSAKMINEVWSPSKIVKSSVFQNDWRNLQLPDASIHAVVGDGSLNVLPSFSSSLEVLHELYRVMKKDTLFVIRCFIRPAKPETLLDIKHAVQAGAVGSFHALKWRLAMSLASVEKGCVSVADIRAAFETLFSDREYLSKSTSWPLLHINTIDAYENSLTRYLFPTLEEIQNHISSYFEIEKIKYAEYELSNQCPTLTLKRRN